MPTAENPLLSIVIPASDGEHTLRCLHSVARHSGGAHPETLVVDDGTTEETRLALRQLEGVQLLRNETPAGFVRACNQGVASAHGQVVVLVDRRAEVAQGWLDPIERAFANPETVAAVPSSSSGAAGVYVAVRAEAFRAAGGLDEARPDAVEALLERFMEGGSRVELIDDAALFSSAGDPSSARAPAGRGPGGDEDQGTR